MIAFLHPRSCAGILIELLTPTEPAPLPASPLRFKRLVLGAQDPRETSRIFKELFGLSEQAVNGGPRIMLPLGQSALLVVPVGEVGGKKGMVALSLFTRDLEALIERLEGAGVSILRGTNEVTLAPDSTHGVHLHISRYD